MLQNLDQNELMEGRSVWVPVSRNPIWKVSIAYSSIHRGSWYKEVNRLKVWYVCFLYEFKICKRIFIIGMTFACFLIPWNQNPHGFAPIPWDSANEFKQSLMWTTASVQFFHRLFAFFLIFLNERVKIFPIISNRPYKEIQLECADDFFTLSL